MFEPLRKLALFPKAPLERELDFLMSIDGQISRVEAKILMDLAKSTPPETVIVEIGSYRGRSTIALAFGTLEGAGNRVYAIDPHLKFQGILGGCFGPADQAEFYHNVVSANVGEIVSVVSLPSIAAARSWRDRNVSLLWVDGDHSYKAVREDFEAWEAYVISGGTIAFHDNTAPGVQTLIQELSCAKNIVPVGRVSSLSWFKNKSFEDA